jgi:hypothetical protein
MGTGLLRQRFKIVSIISPAINYLSSILEISYSEIFTRQWEALKLDNNSKRDQYSNWKFPIKEDLIRVSSKKNIVKSEKSSGNGSPWDSPQIVQRLPACKCNRLQTHIFIQNHIRRFWNRRWSGIVSRLARVDVFPILPTYSIDFTKGRGGWIWRR